ncbi:MAG: hypothetical protein R3335_14455, partial [Anaerolineales bacterium]|nr:hypothetical protein [Anaerolineales bacterium]
DDALELEGARVSAVRYSTDGKYLAAAGDDNTVWVWQMPSGELALRLGGHTEKVNAVAFSPDMRLLASASNDGTVQVWEVNFSDPENLTPTHISTFDHGDWVSSIDFSADSRRLVSGAFDSSVAVWDLEDPQLLGLLYNSTQNQVLSVDMAPDGDQLAAGTVQGEVHYWDNLLDSDEFR